MERKTKKIIIFCIIVLTFICITILSIISYLQKNIKNQESIVEELGGNMMENYVDDENNVISKRAYFDINTCMMQYLNILNTKKSVYYGVDSEGKYSLIVDEKTIKKDIYDVLSTSYIEKRGITVDNIYDHVSTIDESTIYVPIEAIVLQNKENIQSFLAHGLIENMNLEVIDEIYAIVNIDKRNSVFSIEPIYGKYENIKDIQISQLDNQIVNGIEFQSVSLSSENVSKDYINIYKRIVLGNSEIMYYKLDKEYREKRFENLEDFKKYIEINKKEIISIRVAKYRSTIRNEYNEYICIDQKGKYYIFKETAPFQYTVMLDNYTIPTEDFMDAYNSSREEEKVVLNIEKFFMGINDKNYKYSYNLLAESFRNNKYPTKEEFIKYVESNFFEKNEIEYNTYKEENGVYIYKIKVSDATGKSAETKQYNMIVRLKEGTNFEMSFSEN